MQLSKSFVITTRNYNTTKNLFNVRNGCGSRQEKDRLFPEEARLIRLFSAELLPG